MHGFVLWCMSVAFVKVSGAFYSGVASSVSKLAWKPLAVSVPGSLRGLPSSVPRHSRVVLPPSCARFPCQALGRGADRSSGRL